ncbi:MAG: hypothetical protein AAFX78_07970 [Cyanobacteria bacterium J06638_20]
MFQDLRFALELRKRLDGYTSLESRQKQRYDQGGGDDAPVRVEVNVHDRRSRTYHQTHQGSGDNVAGDTMQGDKVVQPTDAATES